MKKYIWANTEYHRKNKTYFNWMLLFGTVTLLLLFILPEDLKKFNLIPLVAAMFCWIMSWRYQTKDQKLKEIKKDKL